MFTPRYPLALLALVAISLSATTAASPVPEFNSTAFVDVPSSTSYSQLIMANPTPAGPAASSPSSVVAAGEGLITPSNVDIPNASATFSLTGKLPGKSAAPAEVSASASAANESGGIRVVGSANPASSSEDGDGEDQPNSAGVFGIASPWVVGAAGLVAIVSNAL